ncbi:dethiobiotin synthase [Paracoccus aestuariivivens]|uniref:ATP-dependent dethiobiotin synthetase BioD n=1 Tax=Paracoccus aestuariivivens TaxID=1820333 RepID=A0A6L6JEU7_9RHOB|nr:dethiobiotin synthase [Paracoccus aestuariivivens]MTH78461.1 ATP-dependent dethiobiotin synthetase BioD [Paracoccus aestuariivivens]
MSSALIVTGTDTGIGKTVFAAGLTRALGATYWKPVQSGIEDETDSQTVARLSGRPVLPEGYALKRPASPHLSAAEEGIEIAPAHLRLPDCAEPLVIEGAGGVLVPLHENLLLADLMAVWRAPAIIVARTGLGTINHSLMTIEALRARKVDILGIAFVGDDMADSRAIICRIGNVHDLGRLPRLTELTPATLQAAFHNIDLSAIRGAL